MRKFKQITSAVLAAAMVLSLAACGSAGNDAPAAGGSGDASAADGGSAVATMTNTSDPTYGGSATFYYQNFNEVFDPAMGENYTYSLYLETLWTADWGMNDPSIYNFDANAIPYNCIAGQIAKDWTWDVYEDGTGSDLTVTIRDDVHFQEKDAEYDVFGGRAVTADDIIYSYDRTLGVGTWAGKEAPNYDGMWMMVLGDVLDLQSGNPIVEKVDDYTVVFHLKATTEAQLGAFMQSMVNITGVEWDTLTTEQQNDWHYACGTGPFILTDYSAGSYYKFKKNENYYDEDERHEGNKLPYLDEVTLTSVGDSAAMMASFIAGDLDYISFDSSLSNDQGEELINSLNGNLQVLTFKANAGAINVKVNAAPFDDIRVRIALQKAINLEEVNSAYYGYETPLQMATVFIPALTAWSSYNSWSDELKAEYSYDPEGAKALLAEAGYPDGFDFTVVCDPNADQDLFELAKSYFAAIGVNMTIETAPDMMAAHQIQGDAEDHRASSNHLADYESGTAAVNGLTTTGFANATFHDDAECDKLAYALANASSEDQAAAAVALDQHVMEQHWLIALSGTTQKYEYLSARIGGMSNGERISYSHFTKPFLARIWVSE